MKVHELINKMEKFPAGMNVVLWILDKDGKGQRIPIDPDSDGVEEEEDEVYITGDQAFEVEE